MYNHQLNAFIQAAELGSFNKAAEALFISTPSLVQQITLLEGRCGFSLFIRSNRGVSLTLAGQSLYQDAKTIVRLSEDAIQRAKALVTTEETTVRIGTSLLFKCRMLPELWPRVSLIEPHLKIEIVSIDARENRGDVLADCGLRYDLWEGIYAATAWEGKCGFLELNRQPLCCAVS